ncbi:MAG TPA: hypothetical protein VL240_14660 [Candidatus Binatia bacterium]|nr:hypothetical protein [Candidatus Binatia bacterium]
MKSLRLLALLIATLLLSLPLAYGQQEVDPDHFDQPSAKVLPQNAQAGMKPSSYRHHQHNRVKMASRHGSRMHHHHAHVSA